MTAREYPVFTVTLRRSAACGPATWVYGEEVTAVEGAYQKMVIWWMW